MSPKLSQYPPAEPPPPARIIDDHSAFTVRHNLHMRPRGHGLQYLVDWEGYGPEERSWVPRSFILKNPLIAGFEASAASTSGQPP